MLGDDVRVQLTQGQFDGDWFQLLNMAYEENWTNDKTEEWLVDPSGDCSLFWKAAQTLLGQPF